MVDPEVNNLEQVSTDGHQMSLAERGRASLALYSELPCRGGGGSWLGDPAQRAPISRVGALYSDVQCIMGNGHIGSSYEQTDRQPQD